MQAPSNNQMSRNQFIPRPSLPPLPSRPFDISNQSPTLPGRFVSSEDDISPGEVLMDNSIFYFPTKDLSRIFIRQWNRNGELERLTYVLEQPEQSAQQLPAPPMPSTSQSAQADSALVDCLNNLNQGLSQAFGQIGQTMESMQHSINSMRDQLKSMSDGGIG